MSPNTVECGGCHRKFKTIRQAMDHQYEQHPSKADQVKEQDRVDDVNAGLDWDEALDALDEE